MIDIIDAAVSWNVGWMNEPSLEFLVPEVPGDRYPSLLDYSGPWLWFAERGRCRACAGTRIVQLDRRGVDARAGEACDRCTDGVETFGWFYIRRERPVTSMFFESKFGGGALGRTLTTWEGGTVKTNGGWSSNAGQVNRKRLTDRQWQIIFPEPVVEATYRSGNWGDLGMAGLFWDLSFAHVQVTRFLPGVELKCRKRASDLMASSEQSAVITAGIENADDLADFYVPSPAGIDGGKPDKDSPLYQLTEAMVKYDKARTRVHR